MAAPFKDSVHMDADQLIYAVYSESHEIVKTVFSSCGVNCEMCSMKCAMGFGGAYLFPAALSVGLDSFRFAFFSKHASREVLLIILFRR